MGGTSDVCNEKEDPQPKKERVTLLHVLTLIFAVGCLISLPILDSVISVFHDTRRQAIQVILEDARRQKKEDFKGFSQLKTGTYPLRVNEAGAYCELMNQYVIIEYPDGKMIKKSALHQSRVNFGVSVDEQVYVHQETNDSTLEILFPEDASLNACHTN